MALSSPKSKKNFTRTEEQTRIMKFTLKEMLGSGLLKERRRPRMSLFFLKESLNCRALTAKK